MQSSDHVDDALRLLSVTFASRDAHTLADTAHRCAEAIWVLLEDDGFWRRVRAPQGAAGTLSPTQADRDRVARLLGDHLSRVVVAVGYTGPPPADQLVGQPRELLAETADHLLSDAERADYTGGCRAALQQLASGLRRQAETAVADDRARLDRAQLSLVGMRVLQEVFSGAANLDVPDLAPQVRILLGDTTLSLGFQWLTCHGVRLTDG
jgi:hypothetical protein